MMTRGQTLPAWLVSALITITFALFMVSYGTIIATQFRAQSAADSLASATVAIQSQNFNQMTEVLYASDVEEYRLRHLLEALRYASDGSGGCGSVTTAKVKNLGGNCLTTWTNLKSAYRRSVTRYDQDAQLLNQITSTMSFTNAKNDVSNLIAQFNQICANPHTSLLASSVECGPNTALFSYNQVGQTQQRTGLKSIIADATHALLPSFYPMPPSTANLETFGPIAVEVAVCATVPPLLQMTWPIALPSTKIVARAAATNAIIEEDWIQPGNTINPKTGYDFQPFENYSNTEDLVNKQDWYNVNYGGNSATVVYQPGTALDTSHITARILSEEFSARVGWWGPVQIAPFSTVGSSAQLGSGCS